MVKSKKPNLFERDVEIGSLCNKMSLRYNGRAIIYARVSTKNQTNGVSLQSQIQFCEDYCKDKNYEVIETVTETKSAKTLKNQKNLVNIVYDNRDINIVIFEASRLSRNLKDCINLMDLCSQKNIVIHIVEKGLISTNSNDLKVIINDLIDGQTEITNLSSRMKRSVRYKKINNIYFASVPKYGFNYTGTGISKKIITNPSEQKIALLIRKFYYGGSVKEIENLLAEITGDKRHKLYNYKDESSTFSVIDYGNMRY